MKKQQFQQREMKKTMQEDVSCTVLSCSASVSMMRWLN